MEKGRENVVLFPFMAEGHIILFLAFALHITQMGYSVTFVNTPLNIKKLRESFPPGSSSIKLFEIPFNSSDHGLPPDSEDTDVLPYSLSLRLLEASLHLKLPLRKLLRDLIEEHGVKPVCVISDLFFGWAADVAHELGIFHAIFSITGGFGMACYCSVWLNLPHKDTECVEFQLPDFPEAGIFHVTQLTQSMLLAGEEDSFTNFQRRNIRAWSNADAFIFNTVEELDKTGLMYFRRKLGIPVYGIGPILLSDQDRATSSRETTISAEECVEWLDKKEANSVIYISFGSQNTISASQMMNLAKALDASGRSFIWVVRPPLGFDINAEFEAEQWLPEGYVQRIHDQDRGQIVSKWAPQVEILAHKSVALFLSHCGWNSVLEALKNGVPLIGWPMAAEQFYNAKLLVEEVGVCVEVARGTSFDVRQEDIMEKIELVMGENEKGKEIRQRSWKIKQVVRDAVRDEENYKGSSVKAMQEFFTTALLKKEQAVGTASSGINQ
ncbi:UDP-glucuronosyl and UDP-glucosyl transferase [Handroanthus impetiginosus]|uniref:Glycosyltransferase n=1 Tax=Handroanthus impetiginosus TaxID=429701 RepID=A0A2G9I1R5_9LAMI|nr:UDP-glucuronosyl and UDP-glucosyl transferase [Handroanthus impetiginosus]